MKFNEKRVPPPKNMIGPRVMCLSKLIRQEHNKVWAEYGLFSGQQDILFALLMDEGLTLKDIADKMEVSPATASVSVKRMEKAGFIIKKTDKSDARIIRLYPTQKAKESSEEVRNQIELTEAVLHKNLTDEQVSELSDILDTVIQNLLIRSEEKC